MNRFSRTELSDTLKENYDILTRTSRSHCLCTGMMYDPKETAKQAPVKKEQRWQRFKKFLSINKWKRSIG